MHAIENYTGSINRYNNMKTELLCSKDGHQRPLFKGTPFQEWTAGSAVLFDRKTAMEYFT